MEGIWQEWQSAWKCHNFVQIYFGLAEIDKNRRLRRLKKTFAAKGMVSGFGYISIAANCSPVSSLSFESGNVFR